MAEVIAALIILVQTGDAIREIINKGYDVSGKLKQFHDQLDSLSKELERWTTAIIDFGLTNDEELLRKIRDAKSTLDKVKSSLFGKDDDCCGRYSSKVKLWLFPAKLESSIQEVTSFSADIKSSLTGKKEIDTLACERLLQGPSNFHFSSDARYIPLEQTEKTVITALKNSEEHPVILLHGPSGTGKSTLARNLALRFQNETKERIDGHAPRSQQAYTSGPEFDRVVYMECGPEVKLPAKKKYLVEQLAPSAISALAPTDTDDVDNKITKLLHGLLKDKPLLIILDDVWECEGESSQQPSNFLQGMVRLGGERVKWLVTSQSQYLCRGLNIRSFCPVPMEEVKPEDGKRILAILAGVEISALSPEIQDIMGEIVGKTGANLLALTCVASTIREERNKQVGEWEKLKTDLWDVLDSSASIRMHDKLHGQSFWGGIRVGFKRLSRAQKNLLILIHMCEGPSVSSDVVEYLFKQTQCQKSSGAFLIARNALQGRNLLTIKTTSHPALGDKERWSIHDLLRVFINREVFGENDGISTVDKLAKEEIMFKKGSRTKLEHDVLMGVASLYFGNYFGHEFAEKMGISSWTPKSVDLGRQVIDPIAHLLGLTEDEQWTSALHSSIFQVLVKYVRHSEFDEDSTSSLLNSPISKVPILCSLYRSASNLINNHWDLFVGQQIIHALFRLLEEITLVIKAPPNYLSPRDETVLYWTFWGFAVALNNGRDKNYTSDLNHARLQTIIERLMLGLGAVEDSLHSNRLVEISQKSENMSFTRVRVQCTSALAALAGGGGGMKEKMIDFPELLESLVKAMRTKDSPLLQEEGANAIVNLASSGATEIIGLKIVNYPGVLDALVDGLDSSKNQEFQRNSAWALANLAQILGDQIKWKIIMFEGAMRRLIFAILHVHDHEVKKQSARALANLAMGGGGIQEKMIDFPELLESLVKAMRTKDPPILQGEGARAIGNLASFGATEIIGLKIANYPGVLDALVDGLDSSKNQGFQRNSAWALSNLADVPGNQIQWKIIMFEGAVRRLVFAILNVHDHEVKEKSARALANLAMGGGGIQEKMIDFPELLESLVKAMRTKDSPILQKEAARAIITLASSSIGATEIIGLKIVNYIGVLDALVDGLNSSKNQRFQRNSAWALANLARIPGDQIKWKIIMFEGAVRRLIFAMANVDDNDVRKHCARAIRNVAKGGNDIGMKIKVDFPEILDVLENAVGRGEKSGDDIEDGMVGLTLLDPLKAKAIQVSAPEVYLWRGCGELLLGLYKDALEDFDRYNAICTLKIRNAKNVFSLRCCAKAKLGDLQGALADADSHVGLDCTWFSLQERGVVKCMSGNFRGAVEDLNASLRLSGEGEYEVLKHRGFVHFMMDDEGSARADAERAIRCKPSRVNDADYGHRCLGTSSVHYLDFELK